jgi:hypothetical protein
MFLQALARQIVCGLASQEVRDFGSQAVRQLANTEAGDIVVRQDSASRENAKCVESCANS